MQTVIRQASIDDKKAIWDFITVAYEKTAQYKIPDRWNWEYLKNPFVDNSKTELPIFIALKNGHIVGQICAILCHMKIGEEICQVAATGDLIVLPECRGEGIAQALVQAAMEYYNIHIAIFCHDITRRIYYNSMDSLRFKAIPIYRRFIKINRDSVFYFMMTKTSKYNWL